MILKIMYKMVRHGLPLRFIFDAITTMLKYEGVKDLLQIWYEEDNTEEQILTLKAIADSIKDCKRPVVVYTLDEIDELCKSKKE